MFTPLEFFIGQRYTHSKRRNHYISFISLASTLGIMLGVIALIVILSIMNGFEKELRTRILGMVAHITVSGKDNTLDDWQATLKMVEKKTHVIGTAPYIQKQVMITSEYSVHGVLLQGISPQYQDAVSVVNQHMKYGSLKDLQPKKYGIALGIELATALGVFKGDKVTVIIPKLRVTPVGVFPRMRRFTVVATYQMGMLDYDTGTAFIHIEDAARLFKMRDKVSGVRLKLDDLFSAQTVANKLNTQFSQNKAYQYKAEDWSVENKNFFRAMKTEKIVMFVILTLVVFIAVFNLRASLMMVVTDKTADIAILRTLGMTAKQIRRIFMIQGSVLGLIGTILGIVLGILLALNLENIVPFLENLLGIKVFPPDLFYISEVPSELKWSDVGFVALVSILLSIQSTMRPAKRAANIQPAEALRYE